MKSTAKIITGSALVLALLFSGVANANDRTSIRFENQTGLTLNAPSTWELSRVLTPMPTKMPNPTKMPTPGK